MFRRRILRVSLRRKSGKVPAQLILRSPSVTFCRSHKFVPSLFSVHDPPVMNLWSGEAGSEFQCNLRDCIPCSSRHQFFVYFLGLGPKLAQYDIQLQLTWLNLDWSFLKPTTYKPKRKSALIKLGNWVRNHDRCSFFVHTYGWYVTMWYRLFDILIFKFRTEHLCNHMWERRLPCIVALSAGASFSWYVLDPIL